MRLPEAMGSLREMAGEPRAAIGHVSGPKGSFGVQLRAHTSGQKRRYEWVCFVADLDFGADVVNEVVPSPS
jgi:hypothetical protein